jgi:quercetin dioxygenase-like cupin family protein
LAGSGAECRSGRTIPTMASRRVVTGFDPTGKAVFTHDGEAPNTIALGSIGVSEVFWADRWPVAIDHDPDRTSSGFPLEPPPGGASARIIRMPGVPAGTPPDDTWMRVDGDDPAMPGMHSTDTLDLMVVLEGSVILGLDDGQRTINPGEFVIQRGTAHRWRAADEHGWTYFVAMLRPDPSLPDAGDDGEIVAPKRGGRPVRRVVTGAPTIDGGAVVGVNGAMSTLTDLWLTGGPLQSVTQGGDGCAGWHLEPIGDGVSFRLIELSSDVPLADEGWHATATIDIDVILSGRMRLELPGGIETELGAGDVVVQRGTNHRWSAVGDEPVKMAAVMFASSPAAVKDPE